MCVWDMMGKVCGEHVCAIMLIITIEAIKVKIFIFTTESDLVIYISNKISDK